MGLKEYNLIQMQVFEDLHLIGKDNFKEICGFIATLKDDVRFSVDWVENMLVDAGLVC